MEAEDGWVMVVKLYSKIRSTQPEFKPPLFGCSNDLDLIEKTKASGRRRRPAWGGKGPGRGPLFMDGPRTDWEEGMLSAR